MITSARQSALALGLVLSVVIGAFGWLWWQCGRNPEVVFLPENARAEWITYPAPPNFGAHQRVELRATFTRAFELTRAPERARVAVRWLRQGDVTLNGTTIEFGSSDGGNWKDPRETDVSTLLRAGSNVIVVTVASAVSPPAVWLALEGDGLDLRSDSSWTTSLDDATEQPARLATTPMSAWSTPGAKLTASGDLASDPGPRTWPALATSTPTLALFATISVLLLLGLAASLRAPGRWSKRLPLIVLAALALAWAFLFVHNRSLAPLLGFDSEEHGQYVQYILDHGALPLANQGWEMYQPPLYYLIAAATAKLGGYAHVDEHCVALLRWIGWVAGVLQVFFVFASLRLLFPERPGAALLGLVMAACLPIQLYLYQYITNESWAAMLVSASIWLALRIVVREDTSMRSHVVLGAVLGLAMLTKFSALLAVVLVIGVFCARLLVRGERAPRAYARTIGATMTACVVVCGWHFARVAWHFGNPFIGNWDPATGFRWWQEPGYHSLGYYVRFGSSLDTPIFSALHSFPDAIYSTLWGDGLVGGRDMYSAWPPWNYELMSAGYLLALVPCSLLLLGCALATWRLVRAPRAEWLLLVGLLAAICFGVVVMTIKIPSYAQAKAFYGSSALIPLCALAALGLDAIASRARGLGAVVCIAFGTWALAAYATFWSVGGAPFAPRSIAEESNRLVERAFAERSAGLKEQALDTLRQVIAIAPDASQGYVALGTMQMQSGDFDAAIRTARETLRVKPGHLGAHEMLGGLYANRGELERALRHYQTCLDFGPDNSGALVGRAEVLARLGRWKGAIDSLQLPMTSGKATPAIYLQLADLLVRSPIEGLHDAVTAVHLAEIVSRQAGEKDEHALEVLAGAYASATRFDDAVRTQEILVKRLHDAGSAARLAAAEQRLELFRAHKPVR